VIVISAPSGAGKTTLCKRLLQDDARLRFSVSTTTRPPRTDERDGVDYRFVGRPEFEDLRAAGEFAEWAVVNGDLYGTSARALREANDAGVDILLDIDTQGAASIRRAVPDAVLIFIMPPGPQALRERLAKRGTESPEAVRRRLALAAGEVRRWAMYDHVIVNDDLDTAYGQLRAVLEAARCRTSRQEPRIRPIASGFESA
jgi:guanylate kinase